MKKLLIPLFALLAFTVTATAQDKMGKRGHHHKQHNGMMAKQLNFSEDQKKQAKTINEDARKKMLELNRNESITVKEMRDRRYAIQKERKTKMQGLLTAEQKTKMAQLRTEQKVKREAGFTKRMEKMKTNLNLSDEQLTKLKTQREANQARAEKIKNNESLSRTQKKEQLIALKADARDQHKKIFTPDQLKKMEELKKNHENRSRSKK